MPLTEAQDQVKINNEGCLGEGNRDSRTQWMFSSNFNSKGNAKDSCIIQKSMTVCLLSVFFYHGTLFDEKGLPRTDGCARLGQGISASKVDLVTW